MDNDSHKNTWNNFTKFVLWGTIAVIDCFNLDGNIFTIISNEFSFFFRKSIS